MNTFTRALALSFFLSSLVVAQSSINGEWSGIVQDGVNEHRLLMSLTVNEEGVVTGSIIETAGVELSIQDGSLVDTQVQFTTAQTSGETRVVTQWVGTVSETEIAFTRATDGSATQSVTVRRN